MKEERVEWALALVRPDGFNRDRDEAGTEVYTAEITYPKDREHLLLRGREVRENPASFGFHYDPYNFDSNPERDFFELILREMNLHPDDVEDVYFTGGLADPAKTDFHVEYRGEDRRWHRYTPDFVIRKRAVRPGAGRVLIVEVKDARFEQETLQDEARFAGGEEPRSREGRKAIALRRLERLNPDRLKYELLFVKGALTYDELGPVRRFVREPDRVYTYDPSVAERIKASVLEATGTRVRRIILFGSRARGDAQSDSDYDALVVLDKLAPGEEARHPRGPLPNDARVRSGGRTSRDGGGRVLGDQRRDRWACTPRRQGRSCALRGILSKPGRTSSLPGLCPPRTISRRGMQRSLRPCRRTRPSASMPSRAPRRPSRHCLSGTRWNLPRRTTSPHSSPWPSEWRPALPARLRRPKY